MLKIEWEDLMAVVKLIIPYVSVLVALLILGIIIIVAVKNKEKKLKKLIRTQTGLMMAAVVIIVANLISFGPLQALITLSMDSGKISKQTTQIAVNKAEEIAGEGVVLLDNKDNTLPLKNTKSINLFGWASVNPVYGGAGSGGLNTLYKTVSLIDGIKNAGFKVNENLVNFYKNYSKDRPEMSIQKQSWTLPEPPVQLYSEKMIQEAKQFSDTAVVVLSRIAGEGHHDMPGDVSEVAFDNNSKNYSDFEKGEHYLQLSKTERDMMQLVTKEFSKVIVIYNGANPLEMGFVNQYPQIKSVLWAPGLGNTGFNSLGKILSGAINPSGRAADTFVYDMKKSPWWNNWNKRSYENMKNLGVQGMNAGKPEKFYPSFVNYNEGIYVGYKYYETAAKEGIIDYNQIVQYPFGHGLSYTTFNQKMGKIKENKNYLEFQVKVTNTGNTTGKDVVEVYSNPPYTNGGIEKASANLVEFEKTKSLAPGETQNVHIKINKDDLASYDYLNKKAYVLEKGDYILSINKNSHEIIDQKIYSVKQTKVFDKAHKRSSDKTAATNQFDDAAGDVTYLSRKDKFSNLQQAVSAPQTLTLAERYKATYYINSNYPYAKYLNSEDKMPKVGQKNGLTLSDLKNASYNDPKWNLLVQQMSVDEMKKLIALAGYQTIAIESVGKVQTTDVDGPASLNNNFTKEGSTGFPVAVVIASTWNKKLANDYGKIMGKMAKEMNVTGWYAPGMNIHRVPFGGRNYEYYSEDGMLSGLIAENAVSGSRSQGVYPFIKHFALYDFNAKMVSVWANEQAIREVYLKPFEKAVKDGKANAVMISWNYIGNKWSGGNSNLIQGVLRKEWGFQGMTITDFFRNNGHGFMNADFALSSGVDAMLSTYNGEANNVRNDKAATSVIAMQRASKNILYTNVSSWKYTAHQKGTDLPGWKKLVFAVDAMLGLVIIALSVFSFKKYKKID